ncbi:chromate efflux transporter [compost metagenome]
MAGDCRRAATSGMAGYGYRRKRISRANIWIGVAILCAATAALADGKFKRLSAGEIKKGLVGKVVTDGAHWSDKFKTDGTLESIMHGQIQQGRWRRSGLAIVPFLYGGVVTEHHWLNEKQFVDAVAVAMITPGPVVITVGFIGYLVAGLPGACVGALGTFLPCYLFTLLPAPYFKKYGKLPAVKAFVDGITAAAVGAITCSVIVIARRSIVDWPTVVLALVTVVLLWRFKKLQEQVIVVAAAPFGLAVYPLIHSHAL